MLAGQGIQDNKRFYEMEGAMQLTIFQIFNEKNEDEAGLGQKWEIYETHLTEICEEPAQSDSGPFSPIKH